MIVRIMGYGQWVIEPEDLAALNVLDEQLENSADRDDQEGVAAALRALFDAVQELGTQVPDDVIVESDLVLPDLDATVEEVRIVLESTSAHFGIIPDVHPRQT
ncbi:MAG: hypothetical protein R2722_16090 [Tessaracoccus sp.]